MWNEFDGIFNQWQRRHRFQRAIRWGMRCLAAALAITLIAAILLIWQRLLLASEFQILSSAAALTGLVMGLQAGYFWPVNSLRLARWLDVRFGLKERVSTAWEIKSSGQVDPLWQEPQLLDALSAARRVDLHQQMPFRVERRAALLSAVLATALVAIGMLGQPFFQAAQTQRSVAHMIHQEKAQVNALVQEIDQNQSLTEAQREALTEPLKEALQSLEEARTREQALSALNEAEQKLSAMQNGQGQQQMQELQGAGSTLSKSDVPGLKQVGDALSGGELDKASEQMQSLNFDAMSAEQRQEAVQALDQAAQDLTDSLPQSADDLQKAAEALRQGDTQSAQGAMKRAAVEMKQVELRVAGSQAAGQAANQLQQGQQRARQGTGQGEKGQGQGSGQGQGQGQGQNGKPGQGSGQNPQNAEKGGMGAGRGDQQGVQESPGEAPNTPMDPNNGPGDAGERDYEKIYVPEHLGGEHDMGLAAPQSGQAGSQVIGQQGSSMGTEGQGQVPYIDALPAYQDAYRQAIQNGQIPPYLAPVIQQYFSSLEPK